MSEPLLSRLWYGEHPLQVLLRPLAMLFGVVSRLRRRAYQLGLLKQQRVSVPVIIVGNISVGGVGKTPVVIDLVQRLKAEGWRPGVVSRGYGGRVREATPVSAQSDPEQVGDEPVLIAQRTACPVVVGARRAQAARLLATQGVNVIVADDGLQHYALARDFEIVVVDGQRRHGNGWLLPAGPLREPPERVDEADLVLVTGSSEAGEFGVVGQLGQARHLLSGQRRPVSEFNAVHAIAGIGNPGKFFDALDQAGLSVTAHAFSDHHRFNARDLRLDGDLPILMTEKDAVKCQAFRDSRTWAVEYDAHMPAAAWQIIRARLPRPLTL